MYKNKEEVNKIDSHLSRQLKLLLDKSSIRYSTEYPIKIKDQIYRFDFAILDDTSNPQIFIEIDGLQHDQDSLFFDHKQTKINDLRKEEYAHSLAVEVIRLKESVFKSTKLLEDYFQYQLLAKLSPNLFVEGNNLSLGNKRYIYLKDLTRKLSPELITEFESITYNLLELSEIISYSPSYISRKKWFEGYNLGEILKGLIRLGFLFDDPINQNLITHYDLSFFEEKFIDYFKEQITPKNVIIYFQSDSQDKEEMKELLINIGENNDAIIRIINFESIPQVIRKLNAINPLLEKVEVRFTSYFKNYLINKNNDEFNILTDFLSNNSIHYFQLSNKQ